MRIAQGSKKADVVSEWERICRLYYVVESMWSWNVVLRRRRWWNCTSMVSSSSVWVWKRFSGCSHISNYGRETHRWWARHTQMQDIRSPLYSVIGQGFFGFFHSSQNIFFVPFYRTNRVKMAVGWGSPTPFAVWNVKISLQIHNFLRSLHVMLESEVDRWGRKQLRWRNLSVNLINSIFKCYQLDFFSSEAADILSKLRVGFEQQSMSNFIFGFAAFAVYEIEFGQFNSCWFLVWTGLMRLMRSMRLIWDQQ